MKYMSILLFFVSIHLQAQPNCNVYLWEGDSLCYKSCLLVERATKEYYQYAKEYQQLLDEALEICPTFAYAYREKSQAYVKSGDFLTWKQLIDKAVEHAPLDYLSVRASLRYKFFADYTGAIADIDRLDSLLDRDIGESSNGTYHLNMVKALCYKALGDPETAMAIMEDHIASGVYIGVFDYIHIGVLYLDAGSYSEAIAAFEKQTVENDLAENHFYMALAFKALKQKEQYVFHLEKAKNLYRKGYNMHDPYGELFDEIYLEDIEKEMNIAYSK